MEQALPVASRERNWVIPDGVDRARFAPSDRARRPERALGWSPDEVTVITVGRRDPVKRFERAEAAAALAVREIPDLRWRATSEMPS